MKRQVSGRKGLKARARIALVAICGGALFVAMALPAMAAPMVEADRHEAASVVGEQHAHINESIAQQLQEADVDGDDAQLGDQPGDENIPDGGDEEVVPPEENLEPPDGGDEEIVPPEEPTEPETQTVEPTPTPTPNKPESGNRTQLAYTGGNATPFIVIGTLIALAGTGLLLKTVLAKKS